MLNKLDKYYNKSIINDNIINWLVKNYVFIQELLLPLNEVRKGLAKTEEVFYTEIESEFERQARSTINNELSIALGTSSLDNTEVLESINIKEYYKL